MQSLSPLTQNGAVGPFQRSASTPLPGGPQDQVTITKSETSVKIKNGQIYFDGKPVTDPATHRKAAVVMGAATVLGATGGLLGGLAIAPFLAPALGVLVAGTVILGGLQVNDKPFPQLFMVRETDSTASKAAKNIANFVSRVAVGAGLGGLTWLAGPVAAGAGGLLVGGGTGLVLGGLLARRMYKED